MSKSKEYSRLNAQQFKGKLHYYININQLGLMVSGLHGQIGLKEMIILDYIRKISSYYSKRGKRPKLLYERLLKALPLLKDLRCYSKSSISRVIKKLEQLKLLEVSRKQGCPINAWLTEKAIDIMDFSVENGVSDIEKQGVSVRKKRSVSATEKRGIPAKEKHNSINNRVNDNLTIVEQGVTSSKGVHIPPHEMSTKENKKENNLFKENSEKVVLANEVLVKAIGNGNRAVSANPFKFEKQKEEKNLIKKLWVNPKTMPNDSTHISELSPISKEKADGQLEFMRKMNLRDKPEVYEIE